MKLVESIMTRNPCYTAGRKITVKGLMLHSVGCPQPKASAFISSWNSPSHGTSCVHGFIDGNDGTVYQTLPWNHRGWHCGSGSKGSGNNTHIGVEMCEPACIKYTAGSNFTCSDMATAKAVAKRTYEAAVELFAMLCKKYSLNPLADGVIISHREGCARGIASNHGDPEHLWTQLGMGYTMDGFRKAVKAAMGGASSGTGGYTKIMGIAVATVEQMKAYLKAKNPAVVQSILDMVPLYLSEGKAEGVRGDIAFAQSCLETGNFTFSGSAVTLSQNNFCGMGVTSNGVKGNSFDTPQLGIRAQVQHLKAYASTDALRNACIDPRFKYVTRGCAEYVEWLGQKENPAGRGWATGAGYGEKILMILHTDCLAKKRPPLVLTKSREHAAFLHEHLQDKTDHIFLLHGGRSEKESSLIRQQMKAVPEDETIVLVATGQYIGEGFNYPRLDTMMLAMPVAWQGNVEQYSGRLHRDYEAKEDVIIYDYVDAHIKVLEGMYHKRLRTYKKMGYEICMNLTSEKQQANSIFDSGTYKSVFERDLAGANHEIVVSSPGLNVPKVKAFMKQVKAAQENGVQVVVLTLSPDHYPAGRTEITRRLVSELEHAGIRVLPHEALHEHYAVIDHEIVWYGSMNFLSAEKEEDNLMRVVSEEIAQELIGMESG